MRTPRLTIKKDYKFIIIILAIVAGFFAMSFILTADNNLIVEELPEVFDSNINKLVISEVMTNNSGVYLNSHNEKSDYVELYNGTSKTINLDGYGLSDRPDKIKWAFSNIELKPNEYIVVSLTGKIEDGLNASFKASSAGKETIILTNANSKVIDAVETVALGKNQVMCRDANGEWYVSNTATPGFENSEKGLLEYHQSLLDESAGDLAINEFLPANKGNYTNKYGKQEGFIEIINISNRTANLADYYLSDTLALPFRFRLPEIELAPGKIYCISTGNDSFGADGHTGFGLDKGNGVVLLSYGGKITNQIEYTELNNGQAYYRADNGKYFTTSTISPGYPNTAEGVDKFQKDYLALPEGLVINEAMNYNYSYLAQNSNNYYDWIELYNNTNQTLNLAEYCLSTDIDDLDTYTLPEVSLEPGEYYVIMCSGNPALTNNSYHHANIKLGSYEGIYLSKNGKLVDSMFIGDVPKGYSYGRIGKYGYHYSTPTPKAANEAGYRIITNEPQYSITGGVFNNVDYVVVELSGPGNIYYTTDGSVPDQDSKLYSEPIKLKKTTVLKSKCYLEGAKGSALSYNSYIINENHTMPVMSVSLSPSSFSAMNNNPGSNTQRQAYAELYEDGSSFKTPCSISLFGGNARWQSKKCYALRFDKKWGAANLEYQVFDNRDCSNYDALVLRTGSTDWTSSIIRDIVGTSLVDDYTDVDVQAYKSVIVYINGKYWGIYNLREKVNRKFIENHYNADVSKLNLVSLPGEIKAGSKKTYNAIREFARTHNLATSENYQKICEMVDIDNIIDYWIAESYVTNNDVVNVRYFSCPTIVDGKLRYIYYDLDYGWFWPNNNYYTQYLTNPNGMGMGYNFENDIILNLFKNKQFKKRWLERLSYNMQNTWNTKIVIGRINEIYNLYLPEIERNQKRWGLTVSQWKDGINDLKSFARKRGKSFLSQTKAFFGLSNKEMEEYFGDLW